MKKLIITLLITIFFQSSLLYAYDDKDYSLHGIKLGIDEEALVEEYPEFNCEKDQANSELRRCTAKFDPTSQPGVFEKLRGTNIDIHITFRNDKLVNINIPFYSGLFEPTSQFFAEQYGQPKILQNSIKNTHGKEQKNTILRWTQDSESIIYWKVDEDRYKNDNTDEYSRILFLLKE